MILTLTVTVFHLPQNQLLQQSKGKTSVVVEAVGDGCGGCGVWRCTGGQPKVELSESRQQAAAADESRQSKGEELGVCCRRQRCRWGSTAVHDDGGTSTQQRGPGRWPDKEKRGVDWRGKIGE